MAALYIAVLLLWTIGGSEGKGVTLINNGYSGIVVYISPTVDKEEWTTGNLKRNIEEAFRASSISVYYGSNSRAYFKDITVALPMSWNTTEKKETFNNMMADIVIRDSLPSLYGEMPYIDQKRQCQAEGDVINFPLSFFSNLEETDDKFGPIGSLVLKLWMSYRYGIFEEVGFPRDPVYPSVICDENKPVPVSCTDMPLNMEDGLHSIRGTDQADCSSCEDLSHCMYVLGAEQEYLLSSAMGFSQIPSIAVFCDDEYFVHEARHPSMHNILCNKESTFRVVEKHYDFKYGDNKPSTVLDTDPTFTYIQQSLRVRIVLDTTMKKDFGLHISTLLLDWINKELLKGVNFGSNVYATGGHYWEVKPIEIELIEDISYSPVGKYNNLEKAMTMAIEDLGPDEDRNSQFIILISDGREADKTNMSSLFQGSKIHVLAIDTSEPSSPNMHDVASASKGYYLHSGNNISKISRALHAFTSTFAYNEMADTEMLYSGNMNSFVVPVDSSVKNLKLWIFVQLALAKDLTLTVVRNGQPEKTTTFTEDVPFLMVQYPLTEELEYGDWEFTISGDITFEVETQLWAETKESDNWIKLDCEIRRTQVNEDDNGARIVARAFRGREPIVNASVVAVVGDKEIPLLDDGHLDGGPDSITKDGVYSAILPEGEDTTVTAECMMKNEQTAAFSHPGFGADNGGFSTTLRQPFCCGSEAPSPLDSTPEKTSKIVRMKQSGFYRYNYY